VGAPGASRAGAPRRKQLLRAAAAAGARRSPLLPQAQMASAPCPSPVAPRQADVYGKSDPYVVVDVETPDGARLQYK
jgi:hypothetical protein